MDTLAIEIGAAKIIYNRYNCPVRLLSNEASKSIFLGLLGTDSVHIYLKQGLINVNLKPVPVLVFDFIIKAENNAIIDSSSGHYEHFIRNSFTRNWQSHNGFNIHYSLKADSATYKLLPQKIDDQKNKYRIMHGLEDISMGKKSIKNTPLVVSKTIENNIATEKITICTYKKNPIYYTLSVHPLSSFPDIKIICLNISKNTVYQSYTFMMRGDEAVSEGHSNGSSFFFKTNSRSKKWKELHVKPKYLITKKE